MPTSTITTLSFPNANFSSNPTLIAAVTPGTLQNQQLISGISSGMASLLAVNPINLMLTFSNINGSIDVVITLLPSAVESGSSTVVLCSFAGNVTLNVTLNMPTPAMNASEAGAITVSVTLTSFRSSVSSWILKVQTQARNLPIYLIVIIIVSALLALVVMFTVPKFLCPKVQLIPFFGLLLSLVSFITKMQFLEYLYESLQLARSYDYSECSGLIYTSEDYSTGLLSLFIIGCLATVTILAINWSLAMWIMCCATFGPNSPKQLTASQHAPSLSDNLKEIEKWEKTQKCGARTVVFVVTFVSGVDITHLFILESHLCNLKSMSAPFHSKVKNKIEKMDKLSLAVLEFPFLFMEVLLLFYF
jgi:hypothetical protein